MVVPIVALSMGVVIVSRKGERAATARIWLPWLLLSGGYWYLRNLVAVGSPIPAVRLGVGDLAFPSTRFDRSFPSNDVADYLLQGDVWRHWFGPGLRDSLGLLWPVVLLLAAGGLFVALGLRRSSRAHARWSGSDLVARLRVHAPIGRRGRGAPGALRGQRPFRFSRAPVGAARPSTRVAGPRTGTSLVVTGWTRWPHAGHRGGLRRREPSECVVGAGVGRRTGARRTGRAARVAVG